MKTTGALIPATVAPTFDGKKADLFTGVRLGSCNKRPSANSRSERGQASLSFARYGLACYGGGVALRQAIMQVVWLLPPLQTQFRSPRSASGTYHFWSSSPGSPWTAPASVCLRALPGSQSSLWVQARRASSVGETTPSPWRRGGYVRQIPAPPPWEGGLGGVCVCVCSMLPSRTLQQDGIRGVPGGNWLPPLLRLTSPFPHWGFLGSFHILVSGSPFGGTRTKIPFSGCHHALGSPRVTAKWEDVSLVPFLKVQNRHLKLLLACHWSRDHTEWPGQLGNVVPPPAGMLADTAVPSAQAMARGSQVDNPYSRSA